MLYKPASETSERKLEKRMLCSNVCPYMFIILARNHESECSRTHLPWCTHFFLFAAREGDARSFRESSLPTLALVFGVLRLLEGFLSGSFLLARLPLRATGGGAGRGLVDLGEALDECVFRVLALGMLFGGFALRAHECLEADLADDAHRSCVHLILGLAVLGVLLGPLFRILALPVSLATVGTTHLDGGVVVNGLYTVIYRTTYLNEEQLKCFYCRDLSSGLLIRCESFKVMDG